MGLSIDFVSVIPICRETCYLTVYIMQHIRGLKPSLRKFSGPAYVMSHHCKKSNKESALRHHRPLYGPDQTNAQMSSSSTSHDQWTGTSTPPLNSIQADCLSKAEKNGGREGGVQTALKRTFKQP